MIRGLILESHPVGKERARTGRYGNHYTPTATKQAEYEIRRAWLAKHGSYEIRSGAAVRINWAVYLPRPKGHYGTGRNSGILKPGAPLLHTAKPDRDNLDKLVCDALKGVAYYDDSHVQGGCIDKFYADDGFIGWKISVQEL